MSLSEWQKFAKPILGEHIDLTAIDFRANRTSGIVIEVHLGPSDPAQPISTEQAEYKGALLFAELRGIIDEHLRLQGISAVEYERQTFVHKSDGSVNKLSPPKLETDFETF